MQIHKYIALRRHADTYMMSIEAGLSADKSRLEKKGYPMEEKERKLRQKKKLPFPISAFGSL